MKKFGAVFWLVIVLVAGFTTFKVKYAVQNIEDELTRVRRQTVAEQLEIRVLTAEWAYLNQPERLAELNRRFLALGPIAARQRQLSIEDIPLRAAAALPDAVPDIQVGTSPDQAAPQPSPSALAVTPAAFSAASAQPGAPGEVATAIPAGTLDSLDALIAQAVSAEPAAKVQLATASPAAQTYPPTPTGPAAPNPLDALFAQIADTR